MVSSLKDETLGLFTDMSLDLLWFLLLLGLTPPSICILRLRGFQIPFDQAFIDLFSG